MIKEMIQRAITARASLFDDRHEHAFRLFNGFTEGYPELIIDLYAKTVVIHNYANQPEENQFVVDLAKNLILVELPWVQAILLKSRRGSAEEKIGTLIHGEKLNHWVREHGVRYAIDLTMNRDCSFYLDTRNLRQWIVENMEGKTMLNTFAYTGSLGVAAHGGGATTVLQTDLNKRYMNVAKTSYTLNGYPIDKKQFYTGDFFAIVKRLKKAKVQVDCVVLDPPFFSSTKQGTVDLNHRSSNLLNKLRPLVTNGGRIIAINNALFVSGVDYSAELSALCATGHVEIEQMIPVAEDFTGYPTTRQSGQVTDTAPFNHSTKIAILRIWHEPVA